MSFSDDLSGRFLDFAVRIIKLERRLCKTFAGRQIYGQLFRAATSSGANYEEARAAESRADFIHKMQIVLKELRESNYWIRLIREGQLVVGDDDGDISFLINESKELARIIGKSVITSKSNIK